MYVRKQTQPYVTIAFFSERKFFWDAVYTHKMIFYLMFTLRCRQTDFVAIDGVAGTGDKLSPVFLL